ncbi:MAG: CPBP family intramembrane metalloprotease [Holophagales bacterium]|nr:MAG: CPBP family intramembrane metalloprotease [Holophagales bacterium]
MDSLLRTTLLKLAVPAAAIAIALVVSRLRGISWRENLGFRIPSARATLGWLAIWAGWIAAGELLIRALDLDQAKAWPEYPPLVVGLRILAIGLVGPVAEELVMRGLVLDRLRRTALGAAGAIGVVAVFWALLHWSYGPGTLALIAADGILLGIARHRTGSLWVPIGMHVLGNLFSIGQSLGLW